MSHPIFRPRIDEEKLEQLLVDMIEIRIADLPAPLKEIAQRLHRTPSSESFKAHMGKLTSFGVDWSRANPVGSGISAQYCGCVFCGRSVADKRGIIEHLRDSHCPVFSAIRLMAEHRFCKSRAWRDEVARQR